MLRAVSGWRAAAVARAAALGLGAAAARAEEPPPRELAIALEPLSLIPVERDGVRQWRIVVTGERRVAGERGAILVLGLGPASRSDLSLLVFEVAGQVRQPVLGGFERNVHVAAELVYLGASGTRRARGAAGPVDEQFAPTALAAGVFVGAKYTFANGIAEHLQVGWAGALEQSTPAVFDAGRLQLRAGIGWSF